MRLAPPTQEVGSVVVVGMTSLCCSSGRGQSKFPGGAVVPGPSLPAQLLHIKCTLPVLALIIEWVYFMWSLNPCVSHMPSIKLILYYKSYGHHTIMINFTRISLCSVRDNLTQHRQLVC